MSSSQAGFDPIRIIVDWFDAREGRLAALIDLYDDGAIVDCCQGGTIRGRFGVERYWRLKLAHPATEAFEVDALFPETDGVCLDYRAHDGTSVRKHFTSPKARKIHHTACATIRPGA